MKVILLADVKKVGQKGEVKEVSEGYAQNVLLPRKLALPGTPENLKKVEVKEAQKADKKALAHSLVVGALKELHGKTVSVSAPTNDVGTLFQAIHEKEIIAAIKKETGVDVPVATLVLDGPIKKAGTHTLQLEGEGEKVSLTLKIT